MTTTLDYLAGIYNAVGGVTGFFQWVALLASGATIAWFLLPHVAGHLWQNILTLIAVIVCIFFFTLKVQPFIDSMLPWVQWTFQLYYKTIPYQYAKEIWDLFYTVLTAWIFANFVLRKPVATMKKA